MRSFQLPGRSTAHAANGMCASSTPASTLAAIDMLRRGGNAVDAAVTASAVLLVSEPHMTGIGGDCFALVGRADGTVIGLNASGRAAAAADEDWLKASGLSEISGDSVHSVTVPGAIDGWDRLLRDHGTIALADAVQPAIEIAEAGSVVTPRLATDWTSLVEKLSCDAGAARHYLKDGGAPACGDVMVYPAFARTLRTLAEKGRGAFYEGELAAGMVSCLQEAGSLLTLEDFAATSADYVDLISTDFQGHEVLEIPPSGQGITALVMLNILSRFEMGKFAPDSIERHHLQIEAAKLAYELRGRHVADPDFADVPVDHLLSDELADRLAARIDMSAAIADIPAAVGPRFSDTIYLCVVDKDRNAVSFINSVYSPFGVGIATPSSSIMFHNRGSCFVAEPGHPNCIGPRKRPMHTIIPTMVKSGGRITMPFGVMGADFQPMGHVQVLLNMLVYGMDVQEAIDRPRFFPDPHSHVIGLEEGVRDSVASGLADLGHDVVRSAAPWGGGQGISIDWQRGTLCGGSDPRKDGMALGY
jgi:gamma-glutamyltranspeptidase/glutathione hydrolase